MMLMSCADAHHAMLIRGFAYAMFIRDAQARYCRVFARDMPDGTRVIAAHIDVFFLTRDKKKTLPPFTSASARRRHQEQLRLRAMPQDMSPRRGAR